MADAFCHIRGGS